MSSTIQAMTWLTVVLGKMFMWHGVQHSIQICPEQQCLSQSVKVKAITLHQTSIKKFR